MSDNNEGEDKKVIITDVFGFGKIMSHADPISVLIIGGVLFALMYGRCW